MLLSDILRAFLIHVFQCLKERILWDSTPGDYTPGLASIKVSPSVVYRQKASSE